MECSCRRCGQDWGQARGGCRADFSGRIACATFPPDRNTSTQGCFRYPPRIYLISRLSRFCACWLCADLATQMTDAHARQHGVLTCLGLGCAPAALRSMGCSLVPVWDTHFGRLGGLVGRLPRPGRRCTKIRCNFSARFCPRAHFQTWDQRSSPLD